MVDHMSLPRLDRVSVDMLRACDALERSDADLRADLLDRYHWKQVFTAMSDLHRAGLIVKFTGFSGELTDKGRRALARAEKLLTQTV
jgi:hypothetical protein